MAQRCGSRRGRTRRLRYTFGLTLASGLAAGSFALGDDLFQARSLPGGYRLAADSFVPRPADAKGEGGLCAGEMGSDRDKAIQEGRCAYSDPGDDEPKGAEDRDQDGGEGTPGEAAG